MLDALNNYNEHEMLSWLREALSRRRALPLTSPDEPSYLGIVRLESSLAPNARRAIDTACLALLEEFLETRTGDTAYLTQLILLTSKLKNFQTIPILARIVLKCNEQPSLDVQLCQVILGVLADSAIPLDAGFWQRIQRLNPERFSGIALAGILRSDPVEAISMLPRMPGNEKVGRVAVMNFDLRFDSLIGTAQSDFLNKVAATLPRCNATFAAPLAKWLSAKTKLQSAIARPTNLLADALQICMGAAASAQRLTPKLFNAELEAA